MFGIGSPERRKWPAICGDYLAFGHWCLNRIGPNRDLHGAVRGYALPMARKVKDQHGAGRERQRGTTKVSSKNQVTIPARELRAAGLQSGDVVRVEALGAGRVVLTRVDELVARYAGSLDTGGKLRRQIEELRDEWR